MPVTAMNNQNGSVDLANNLLSGKHLLRVNDKSRGRLTMRHQVVKIAFVIACGACLLRGQAMAQATGSIPDPTYSAANASADAAAKDKEQPNSSHRIRLTPVSAVTISYPHFYIPGDTYTRPVVCADFSGARDCSEFADNLNTRVDNDSNPDVYPYLKRSGLERFFVGKHHSETISIKITSNSFVTTVPLVTITHDSTSNGEIFARAIRYKALAFPLFLVRGTGAGDTATAIVTMSASDKVESSAAAQTLSAVLAATSLISSPPAVLTKLSSDANKAVATSIDRTISSLYSTSLNEEQVTDQSVALWRTLKIVLNLPRHEGGWNRLKHDSAKARSDSRTVSDLDYAVVGDWSMFFERPRISAFSRVTVECKINPDVSKMNEDCDKLILGAQQSAWADVKSHFQDVLAFPVIANSDNPITLAAYLKQQDWWTDDIKALTPASGKVAPDAVDRFCRQITSTLGNVGFNTIDGFLVIMALAQSALVTKTEGDALTGPSCVHPASKGS